MPTPCLDPASPPLPERLLRPARRTGLGLARALGAATVAWAIAFTVAGPLALPLAGVAYAQEAMTDGAAPASGTGAVRSGGSRVVPGEVVDGGHVQVDVGPADGGDALVRYQLSEAGGTITSATMLDPRFTRSALPPLADVPADKLAEGPIDLVTTWSTGYMPFRVDLGLEGATVTRVVKTPSTSWKRDGVAPGDTKTGPFDELYANDPMFTRVTEAPGLPAVYVWPDPATDTSDVWLEKRFSAGQHAHELELEVVVHNLGEAEVTNRLQLHVTGWHHTGVGGGGAFEYPTFLHAASCLTAGSLEREEWPSFQPEGGQAVRSEDYPTETDFVAVDTRYFAMAAVPVNSTTQGGFCRLTATRFGVIEATWLASKRQRLVGTTKGCLPAWAPAREGRLRCDVAAGTFGHESGDSLASIHASYEKAKATAEGLEAKRAIDSQYRSLEKRSRIVARFRLYMGPKDLGRLEATGAFKLAGEDKTGDLGQILDFGWFDAIARLLVKLLGIIHDAIGSWAIAIVLLTVVVKGLLLPLTNKSFTSMQKMQKLKPEMDALKKKHGSDQQAFQKDLMALYKSRGVNPLAGCLPMLLQMPIWFALYRTIYSSVELYHRPLGGWVQDLSAPDPYYVMPVVLGFLMLAQSFFTPTAAGTDELQQKILKYGMPVMFSAFMVFLPSGLVLYILVNTFLTIIQNIVIRRRMA